MSAKLSKVSECGGNSQESQWLQLADTHIYLYQNIPVHTSFYHSLSPVLSSSSPPSPLYFLCIGWDEGLQGLCKGAKAKLIIPSEFGYGEVGAGGKIPGGATLNFDVEVVDITDPPARPPTPNVFKMIDTDEDNKLSVAEIEAYFKGMDKEMPEGLMESEDKDGDGFVRYVHHHAC